MSYIDAGYGIALSVLAAYAACCWSAPPAPGTHRPGPAPVARHDRPAGDRTVVTDRRADAGRVRPRCRRPPVAAGAGAGSRRAAAAAPVGWSWPWSSSSAAFAFLLVKGLGSSLNYFETVDQALPTRPRSGPQTFRLEGLVVPGIGAPHRRGRRLRGRRVTRHAVAVVNTGNPPQLFQPDIPVVVVGHFSGPPSLQPDHRGPHRPVHPSTPTGSGRPTGRRGERRPRPQPASCSAWRPRSSGPR